MHKSINTGKVCGEKAGAHFEEMKTFLKTNCAASEKAPDLLCVFFGANDFKGKKQSIADLDPESEGRCFRFLLYIIVIPFGECFFHEQGNIEY